MFIFMSLEWSQDRIYASILAKNTIYEFMAVKWLKCMLILINNDNTKIIPELKIRSSEYNQFH